MANLDLIVVKIGSSTLVDPAGKLDQAYIDALCAQIAELRSRGKSVIVVSSGAAAAGREVLGIAQRPSDIPTLQACAATGQAKLIEAYEAGGEIPVRTESRDFDSWYEKRTAEDGKIDWHARTRDIYNLIRAVSEPFPGAFCHAEGKMVRIWECHPFDEMIDFHDHAPGEIIDVFDGKPIVRTVDGSLLIDRYECDIALTAGMLLY